MRPDATPAFTLTEPPVAEELARAERALAKARAAELSARILQACEQGGLRAVNGPRWPELFALWAEVIAVALHKARAASPEVQALVVLGAICGASGGPHRRSGADRIRIPAPDVLKEALRMAAMWADFDGRNHEYLRRKYGYKDLMSVYRALAAQRAREPIKCVPTRIGRARARRQRKRAALT